MCRQGPKGILGNFMPPGAKGNMGYLCRQGPNYLETCDPEGVKEDFGRNLCRQGLKGKSTLKGSHVYRIYAARR